MEWGGDYLHIGSWSVWPAHPLYSKARPCCDTLVIQLRRCVHNGGHQQLFEVLVCVDKEEVLSVEETF